jgi:hypothetical protein
MAKEIDVGASQMGVEILTNKGSEENPMKSIEIQKPPEKPYTIDDHSKMMQAMGQPEQAAKLQKQAVDALTEEGKTMNDSMTEKEISKQERRQKSRELAAEYNRRKESGEDTSEFEGNKAQEPNPGGLEIAMRPKAAVHIMKVEFPINVINEFNSHIDKVLISANVNADDGLQPIPLNIKSRPTQLTINHNDKGVGKQFSDVLLRLGETYMEKVTGIKSKTTMERMWSVHSYEGDYNPIHDHGTRTPISLSCILYLKVPPQIEKLDSPSEEFSLHSFSGAVDGFTYLSWGVNGMKDINMLRPITEEYIKPVTGTMLMFPSWLRHGVMPFFGEGERRTFSANLQVIENK